MSLRLLALTVILCSSAFCQSATVLTTKLVITQDPAPLNIENPQTIKHMYFRSGIMRRQDSFDEKGRLTFSTIANCQSRTGFLIDMSLQQYRSFRVVRFQTPEKLREYAAQHSGRFIPIQSRTIDTGERKVFFGYSAKHLITTMKHAREDGLSDEETIDGWYIDHAKADMDCVPEFAKTEPFYALGTLLVDPPNLPEFHHEGPFPIGLAVQATHVLHLAAHNGKPASSMTSEQSIETLTETPLPKSTFQVPSDFSENRRLYVLK